ncbi:ABC transporter ATP-binding protein [Desulforamulus hydrothermalis]|uniref:ABC transporter related protein n=1 Tax=Desulforamulus hydrothermalis Lam5 = DSM 18033 TaxID=1121428 RepID=K8E733_9FIRM|nr:ABC transporter ATP-binding protein [Desulforamulus hydrothermalis]CCO07288.1 ABC transporter related protein [Desulforamulus hydrothermalis Lam5 = DSM 18033]SHG93243.1 ABC-2 type transport system ATP-binding protein [Desulforamulus hydrothermalis Lam5 = DSM 18033]
MDYVVTTSKLTKTFGFFTAVNQLSINIRPGEIYGFLGPNGSGKSTTIRMLCGILEPTSGSGKVLGFDLATEAEKIKPHIGYMSQKFSLYDDLTVYENLNFYAGLYSVPWRERQHRIQEMVEMANLTGREKELAANLSVGWKQRLALGCAIISKPAILFLDEPTSGISPTSRKMFFNIIQRLANEGTTVMVTTHFMDEAERCSSIAFISEGSLIANDTPDNLKNKVIEGVLAELEIEDPMGKLQEIEQLPYVKECSVHGALLHVLLEKEQNLVDLQTYTKARVNKITPSLEDVFIALSRKKRRVKAGEQDIICAP